MITLDFDSLGDLGYRDLSGAGKNFFERTVVTGIEMLQKDKSHAGAFREIGQQSRERFEAAGGGTDSNDGGKLCPAWNLTPEPLKAGGRGAFCVLELNAFSQDRPYAAQNSRGIQ